MSQSPGNVEFARLAALNLIYEAGLDSEQRSIIVLCACRLPDPATEDYDIVLEFLKAKLDHQVDRDYVLVFFSSPAAYRPSWLWLLKAYRLLDRKYKKNLKALYVVHLTGAYRVIFELANRIVSPKFAQKLHTLTNLHELGQVVQLNTLKIPDKVIKHELHLPSTHLAPLVFGRSLADLARQEGCVANGTFVPAFVRTLVEHLRRHGLHQQGIFRTSPSQEDFQIVKYRINIGEKVVLSKYDIHIAAGLLKVFFKDLPERLIPENLTQTVGDLAGTDYAQEVLDRARERMDKIAREEPPKIALLRFLFDFLAEVAHCSDINLMSPHNLAVVFGPNLIRPNDVGASATLDALTNATMYMQKAKRDNAVIEMLIAKHENVFKA